MRLMILNVRPDGSDQGSTKSQNTTKIELSTYIHLNRYVIVNFLSSSLMLVTFKELSPFINSSILILNKSLNAISVSILG